MVNWSWMLKIKWCECYLSSIPTSHLLPDDGHWQQCQRGAKLHLKGRIFKIRFGNREECNFVTVAGSLSEVTEMGVEKCSEWLMEAGTTTAIQGMIWSGPTFLGLHLRHSSNPPLIRCCQMSLRSLCSSWAQSGLVLKHEFTLASFLSYLRNKFIILQWTAWGEILTTL